MASSVWGVSRHTNNVDIAVWLDAEGATRLLSSMGERFAFSVETMLRAVEAEAEFPCFQVLDLETAMQFHLFVVRSTRFAIECRDRVHVLGLDGAAVRFASAEEVVVQKLRWYMLGNRAGERQWKDIVAVAKVTDLDWAWVEKRAAHFGVGDDLTLLRLETGQA